MEEKTSSICSGLNTGFFSGEGRGGGGDIILIWNTRKTRCSETEFWGFDS